MSAAVSRENRISIDKAGTLSLNGVPLRCIHCDALLTLDHLGQEGLHDACDDQVRC